MNAPGDVTRLLAEIAGGNEAAAGELWPIVYGSLRSLAARFLAAEGRGHTLQPTALVHEAYMRLAADAAVQCHDRGHFFAVAAQAMRRILVDHARQAQALKRGGDRERLPLDEAAGAPLGYHAFLVDLDDALRDLARLDPPVAQVVELRFFGGLTVEEIAPLLGVAPVTVKRMWRAAKGWLHNEMMREA